MHSEIFKCNSYFPHFCSRCPSEVSQLTTSIVLSKQILSYAILRKDQIPKSRGNKVKSLPKEQSTRDK